LNNLFIFIGLTNDEEESKDGTKGGCKSKMEQLRGKIIEVTI
jgi:hypothetical protein